MAIHSSSFQSTILSARCGSPPWLVSRKIEHQRTYRGKTQEKPSQNATSYSSFLSLRSRSSHSDASGRLPRPASGGGEVVQDRLTGLLVNEVAPELETGPCISLSPLCNAAHRNFRWRFQCGKHLKKCSRVWFLGARRYRSFAARTLQRLLNTFLRGDRCV